MKIADVHRQTNLPPKQPSTDEQKIPNRGVLKEYRRIKREEALERQKNHEEKKKRNEK